MEWREGAKEKEVRGGGRERGRESERERERKKERERPEIINFGGAYRWQCRKMRNSCLI